jgi:type I restriction enzyme S subunit
MELGELPEGWLRTTLGEVAAWGSGGTPSRSRPEYFRGNIPWIKTGELGARYIRGAEERISETAIAQSSAKVFPKGAVGIAMYGATIGKLSIWGIDAATNQACAVGVCGEALNNEFLYHFLASEKRNLIKAGKGGAQPNISQGIIKEWPLNLPPLAEQHRIIAKIEELFSELDQGVASLKTAREQIKVYRQSLLKNAFEGKLTAAWRAAHAAQLETAAALQQRIARERQARYQQQLADWQTAGQAGPKPKSPKPLPPLTAEELAELPELPEGWGWMRLEVLSEKITDGEHITPRRTTTGFYLLSARNIQNGFVDLSNVDYVPEDEYQRIRKRCNPEADDVLISCSGSVGRISRVPANLDCVMVRSVALVKLLKVGIAPIFLEYQLQGPFLQKQIDKGKKATAQANLFLGPINNLRVAVCSLSEQQAIVQELESKLSEADQLDQTLATALQQADALRQSILKKAFCGQLVKQDQNDEPATALLERIRAEKASQVGGKARRHFPKPAESLELKPAPGRVIPFPVPLPGIAAKDLHAGILAMAYRLHEQYPERLQHFGHVKAEKISHLVEAHLGLDLERQPFKEAAGPNDHSHLKKVEHRARMANWFDVTRQDSGKYVFHPKSGFERLLTKAHQALGQRLAEVERLLEMMLPMTMRQAEILATVYAAWNNLLLLGKSPSDEEIVTEARENWHESKLKIERDKFFTALDWMRKKGLVPSGKGRFVKAKGEV